MSSSPITADGDWSHESKRCLLLGRKVMINVDSILKSRDITLPTKESLAKAMVFPVVMYGCDSWTTKNAECQRIDAFELWCWRRLLQIPWTVRRSILKEISPETETPILWPPDMKNWFHLIGTSCWKRLKAGGEGNTRGWDGWYHYLNRHEFEYTPGVGDRQEDLTCCSPWGHKESDRTEWLNWTELKRH